VMQRRKRTFVQAAAKNESRMTKKREILPIDRDGRMTGFADECRLAGLMKD